MSPAVTVVVQVVTDVSDAFCPVDNVGFSVPAILAVEGKLE